MYGYTMHHDISSSSSWRWSLIGHSEEKNSELMKQRRKKASDFLEAYEEDTHRSRTDDLLIMNLRRTFNQRPFRLSLSSVS